MSLSAPYLTCQNISFRYGSKTLFENVSFALHPGERWGVIGPNGAGKSTLFSILSGARAPDTGTVSLRKDARIGVITQRFVCNPENTALQVLRSCLPAEFDPDKQRSILEKKIHSHCESLSPARDINDAWQKTLERLQHELEQLPTESTDSLIASALRFGDLDALAEKPFVTLSGGQKKRLQIVASLLTHPDLLLLDEPTNHLDLETVDWLEDCLLEVSLRGTQFFGQKDRNTNTEPVGILIISHDRSLMDTLATHVLEVEMGTAHVFRGNYESYTEQKALLEATAANELSRLQNVYARELAWLRSGTKARTTKQVARIDRAHAMSSHLEQKKAQASQSLQTQLEFGATLTSEERNARDELVVHVRPMGKQILIELKDFSVPFPGTTREDHRFLAQNLNLVIKPGMRLALLGRNGCGKSSLLRYFARENANPHCLFHDSATISYFDQNRESLDRTKSARELLCEKGDFVNLNGRSMHIMTYLGRFLFNSENASRPIVELSGGEESRLLLAKLMLSSANILVLDEPTNDLDIQTLQVLENNLAQFTGALIFTSHDRYFLRKVATHFLANTGLAEHRGDTVTRWELFPDLDQALSAIAESESSLKEKLRKKPETSLSETPNTSPLEPIKKVRLSFKEQREFENCETRIAELEKQIPSLTAQLQNSYLQPGNKDESLRLAKEIESQQAELDSLMLRWEELMERQ